MIPDEVKKILRENASAQLKSNKLVAKLPCGHSSIEITEPRDQILICPVCFKKSYLVYSRIGKSKVEY